MICVAKYTRTGEKFQKEYVVSLGGHKIFYLLKTMQKAIWKWLSWVEVQIVYH